MYSDIRIENTNSSFKDGLALCAIIHRYRPDLIDFHAIDRSNVAENNQTAFDLLEKEYGILPVSSDNTFKTSLPNNQSVFERLSIINNKDII